MTASLWFFSSQQLSESCLPIQEKAWILYSMKPKVNSSNENGANRGKGIQNYICVKLYTFCIGGEDTACAQSTSAVSFQLKWRIKLETIFVMKNCKTLFSRGPGTCQQNSHDYRTFHRNSKHRCTWNSHINRTSQVCLFKYLGFAAADKTHRRRSSRTGLFHVCCLQCNMTTPELLIRFRRNFLCSAKHRLNLLSRATGI